MSISEGSPFPQSLAQGGRRHYYEFGTYRVDVLNLRLLRAGEPVAITPKTLDLLLLLLRQRDRVVAKDELMRDLWPDTAVEEANLTQQIFTLRKILGEGPAGVTYIETVPRRGYRFASEVRETREEPIVSLIAHAAETGGRKAGEDARAGAGVSSSRRAVRAILGLALLAAVVGTFMARKYWPVDSQRDPVMLAVLPFENLSRNPSQEHLADGLEFADSLALAFPTASSRVCQMSDSFACGPRALSRGITARRSTRRTLGAGSDRSMCSWGRSVRPPIACA